MPGAFKLFKSSRPWRYFRRFARDQRGSVLIYVTLALPVLIGALLLAVDAGRLFNLQTDLQNGADALALAGAAELDRKPDAITRANRAIANLVANKSRFSAAGYSGVTVSSTRFLQGLPASDDSAIDESFVTVDPSAARFVEITIAPETLNTTLPAGFIGSTSTTTASAQAVAGFNAAVCQFTPMFMCNPFEGSGISIFDAIKDPAVRRRLIQLKKKGGSSQYAPGNYGFLQPINGEHGADALRDMLALTTPPSCFVQNGVSLMPGFITSAHAGINVRFDIYKGVMSSNKSDPAYRPAMNVRKGFEGKGNQCNAKRVTQDDYEPDYDYYPGGDDDTLGSLPRDNCFYTGSCPNMGGRMGDGVWDIDSYKTYNGLSSIPYNNANPASRYEVYRYEIENGLTTQKNIESHHDEDGVPECYTGTPTDSPDRRILYIAAIDCIANNVEDDNSGNSGPPVPVTAFIKLFLTEPAGEDTDNSIWGEVVGVVEPGTVANDVARDIVQLYR